MFYGHHSFTTVFTVLARSVTQLSAHAFGILAILVKYLRNLLNLPLFSKITRNVTDRSDTCESDENDENNINY